MKKDSLQKYIFAIALSIVLLAACKPNQVIENSITTAKFSDGYVAFWGDFYANKGVKKNVLSMDLYTAGLSIDSAGYYVGSGIILSITDIFQLTTDTLLRTGTYTMDTTCQAQTFLMGMDFDGRQTGTYLINVSDFGTSVEVLTSGTFSLSYNRDSTIIDFDFRKADGKPFTAQYRGLLYTYDMTFADSVSVEKQAIRRKFYR